MTYASSDPGHGRDFYNDLYSRTSQGCFNSTVQAQYGSIDSSAQLCFSGAIYDFGVKNDQVAVKKVSDEEKILRRRQEEEDFKRLAKIQNEKKMKYLFTNRDYMNASLTQGRKPKNRSYSDLGIRRESYISWQSECTLPTWMFAMCGFFYKGVGDLVECYHCGLSNRGWYSLDDPFVYHKDMKPHCEVVIQLTGKGISSCYDLHDSSTQNENNLTGQNKPTAESGNHTNVIPGLECKVCLVNPLQVSVQPCGHFAMCESCCQRVLQENKRCPVCRSVIQNVIKTIMN